MSFVLLMSVNQDVQRRMQAEIDRVIGIDELPNTSQLPLFVYSTAVMKEVLRFAPVAPLGNYIAGIDLLSRH